MTMGTELRAAFETGIVPAFTIQHSLTHIGLQVFFNRGEADHFITQNVCQVSGCRVVPCRVIIVEEIEEGSEP